MWCVPDTPPVGVSENDLHFVEGLTINQAVGLARWAVPDDAADDDVALAFRHLMMVGEVKDRGDVTQACRPPVVLGQVIGSVSCPARHIVWVYRRV
jgi:hypothetical protein